jgi:hypothetical protein
MNGPDMAARMLLGHSFEAGHTKERVGRPLLFAPPRKKDRLANKSLRRASLL